MSQSSTHLSGGTLNGQTTTIELIEPGNHQPPVIIVKWPQKPTVCPPATFQLVASAMRVLSNAVVELAAVRVWKKL